jgi:pimeloyl-ACP methyl ester carboxylesterase
MAEYITDPHSGLDYLAFGEGPPLLLLHGNGADAQLYLPILASLSPYFRILAPDLPGHGHSLACKPTSIENYLNTVRRFIDAHIDGPFFLVAHSLGALVSHLLMDSHKPLAAVWMEPAIFQLRPLVKAGLPLLAKTYRLDKHRREPLVKYMHGLAWAPQKADPVRVASFVEAYMQSCREVQSLWIKHYPEFLPWDFSEHHTPIACIRGQKDTFISKATSSLVQQLPQGKEIIIPEAGHCLLNENNLAIVKAIQTHFKAACPELLYK